MSINCNQQPSAPDKLKIVHDDITTALQSFHGRFSAVLTELEGQEFGSFEENRRLAQMIQEAASLLRLAFLCPKCDKPARLKCVQSGNSKHGVFSFAHTSGTHGATARIPKLTVCEPKKMDDKDSAKLPENSCPKKRGPRLEQSKIVQATDLERGEFIADAPQVATLATVRARLRQAVDESGLTQEAIGLRMGFAKGGARAAVSRILNLNEDYDPRLSTLLALANAIGRSLPDFM